MDPEKQMPEQKVGKTLGAENTRAQLSIDESIELILKYSGITFNSAVVRAAQMLSSDIRNNPEAYSELQRARAIAGILKLALGTHEEYTALEHAGQLSGLDTVIEATVLSLSAIHGPSGNLNLVTSGLIEIDRELAASVLIEVAQHDPSESERTRALSVLSYRLQHEAQKIVKRLPESETLITNFTQHCPDVLVAQPIQQQSKISSEDRKAIERILPAIQQVLAGTDTQYRRSAIDVLAQEKLTYAIPLLTLVTQVRDSQVREAGVQALTRIDPVVAQSLREGSPTLRSRVMISPEDSLL